MTSRSEDDPASDRIEPGGMEVPPLGQEVVSSPVADESARRAAEADQAAKDAEPAWIRWIKGHRSAAAAIGSVCTIVAFLFGVGLFTKGGLEGRHLKVVAEAVFSYGRLWMVVFLVVAAVIFWIAEREWLRALLPWVLAIIGYLLAGMLVLSEATAPQLGLAGFAARAKAFGLVSVVFLLIVAALVLRKTSDRAATSVADLLSVRTSVGSTVLILWTAVALYGIALIGAFVILETLNGDSSAAFECTTGTDVNCVTDNVWTDYLILLGVPGAAAAVAKIKGEGGGEGDEPQAGGTSSNDGPGTTTAVADIQYLVFNAFAMLFVLASLVQYGRLPEIPDLVLALTGASALIYTVNRRVDPVTPK